MHSCARLYVRVQAGCAGLAVWASGVGRGLEEARRREGVKPSISLARKGVDKELGKRIPVSLEYRLAKFLSANDTHAQSRETLKFGFTAGLVDVLTVSGIRIRDLSTCHDSTPPLTKSRVSGRNVCRKRCTASPVSESWPGYWHHP